MGRALGGHPRLPSRAQPQRPRGIRDVDFACIDGDHNWYTVIHELRLLERAARESGRRPPVSILHDVGWPYGRRDMYYDPKSIPVAHRLPYERHGIRPDGPELVADDGLNSHLYNAIYEHQIHNGVLSAVEDFIAESGDGWKLVQVAGLSGVGVLAPPDAIAGVKGLPKALERLDSPDFLREHLVAVEESRIWSEIARAGAKRDHAAATRRAGELERKTERTVTRLRERDAEVESLSAALAERGRELDAANSQLEETQSLVEKSERGREGAEARARQLQQQLEEREERLRRMADELAVVEAANDAAREDATGLRGQVEAALDARVALWRSDADLEVELAEAEAERETLARENEALLARLRAAGPDVDRGPAEAPASDRDDEERSLASALELAIGAPLGDPRALRLGLPSSIDRRGLLEPLERGRSAPDRPTVDVVVCVHNALDDLRRCLWSVVAKGDYPLHLIVVNDGSDAETTAELRELDAARPRRHRRPQLRAAPRLLHRRQPGDARRAGRSTWCCSTATRSSPTAGSTGSWSAARTTAASGSSARSPTPPAINRCPSCAMPAAGRRTRCPHG